MASAAQYTLTTAVSPGGGGTINPAAGVHTYASGTVVDVTATPAAGYAFSSWSGACSGAGACAVTMDADKSVTANFTVKLNVDIATVISGVELSWMHMAASVHHYEVHRSATKPYFEPGGADSVKLDPDVVAPAPGTQVNSPDAVDLSIPGTSYFYLVVPALTGGAPLGASNRTGVVRLRRRARHRPVTLEMYDVSGYEMLVLKVAVFESHRTCRWVQVLRGVATPKQSHPCGEDCFVGLRPSSQ